MCNDEIVPVEVSDGRGKPVIVSQDEHPRPGSKALICTRRMNTVYVAATKRRCVIRRVGFKLRLGPDAQGVSGISQCGGGVPFRLRKKK
jgi:hypothetical protein